MLETYRARRRLHALIRHWVAYRDLISEALATEEVSPRLEKRGLRLQARIAARLPAILDAVPAAMRADAQRHHKLMAELLNCQSSLTGSAGARPIDQAEFRQAWHEHYLFLNQLKGMRPTPPPKPPRRVERVPTGTLRAWRPRRRIVGGPVGWILRLGFLVLIVFLVGRGVGVHWVSGGRLAIAFPADVSAFGQNLVVALRGIWADFGTFMAPVIAVYGLTWTVTLLLLLVLALLYWGFVRG